MLSEICAHGSGSVVVCRTGLDYTINPSGVPQGSVLGPLLFLAYVNDIWRGIDSSIRLFADDCVIYRQIKDSGDIGKLQTNLNRLEEWAVENEMKINPDKSKAVSFMRARVRERLRYYFGDQLIPETNSFKYLGIIICSDLSWAEHVNCGKHGRLFTL
jgi:hypothetical protein